MFLRSDCAGIKFPQQVTARRALDGDLNEIRGLLSEYCRIFGFDFEGVISSVFTVVTPESSISTALLRTIFPISRLSPRTPASRV